MKALRSATDENTNDRSLRADTRTRAGTGRAKLDRGSDHDCCGVLAGGIHYLAGELMSEKRTASHISRVVAVLYWPHGDGAPHRMMAVSDVPRSGQFFCNDVCIFFSEEDKKYKKQIIYETRAQVRRTTRNSTKVRLRT